MIALPSEIWEKILVKLDFASIVRSKRICRDTYNTIEFSSLLNYIIELGVAGYTDNPNFIASPAHKLELLTESTQYWKQISWEKIPSLNQYADMLDHRYPEVSRGIAIRRTSDPSERQDALLQDHYEIIQLKQRRTENEIKIRTFGIAVSQSIVAFDPGQDLLILNCRS